MVILWVYKDVCTAIRERLEMERLVEGGMNLGDVDRPESVRWARCIDVGL